MKYRWKQRELCDGTNCRVAVAEGSNGRSLQHGSVALGINTAEDQGEWVSAGGVLVGRGSHR